MKKLLPAAIIISIVFTTGCQQAEQPSMPRNIILMIGDGMGIAQVYAGMTVAQDQLNMERCTHVGLQKTYSADSYITDSGASGTAMACGVKTKNGAIGVDARGQPVTSILELAGERGLSTGLVATSTITHATPAAFIAHNPDRGDYEAIAADFTATDVDVLIGGGAYHFTRREDGRDLLQEFVMKGYHVASELSETEDIRKGQLICLTDTLHNPPAMLGRGDMLPKAASKALELLSQNRKGFFLMIEGSQIDWAGHANNSSYLISEVLDFDEGIGHVLDFAQQDGETLVIVTADHETGGMALTGGDIEQGTVEAVFGTDGHTSVMVPVFAYGPGAELFTGIYENTDIFHKMRQALGL